jgi:hypothetical protein
MELAMKARVISAAFRLAAVALGAIVLTLAGCLITGETVRDSGLLFFGSVSVVGGRAAIVVPEVPQRHYRGVRISASAYPVQVYRIVIVYRDGGEVSYAVGWRFTDRVRYHDLRLRGDRPVRELRIYQRPVGPPVNEPGRRRGKGERREYERGPAGPVYFRIYGLP